MKKAILAKWAILLLIAGVVAFDLRFLLVPAEYWFILAAELRGHPNECSIAQAIHEARIAASRQAVYPLTPPRSFESEITLNRTEAGLDLWDTPQGPIWTVHGDSSLPFLLWEQFRDIYEPEGHEVRKGDIVLDCGANVGVFTRKALSRGASLVVAIEPAPQTIAAAPHRAERTHAGSRARPLDRGRCAARRGPRYSPRSAARNPPEEPTPLAPVRSS